MPHAREGKAMTPDEFDMGLKALGWKQADWCRMTGTDKNTPSRWMNGITPIPVWAPKFMEMAQRIKDLAALIEPPK